MSIVTKKKYSKLREIKYDLDRTKCWEKIEFLIYSDKLG